MSHPTWENRATPNFSEHFATPCNIAHNSRMESALPKYPSTIIPPVRHGRNVFTLYGFTALVRLWAPSRHSFIEDFALRCQLEVVVVLNGKPPFNEASHLLLYDLVPESAPALDVFLFPRYVHTTPQEVVRFDVDVYFHEHSLLNGEPVYVIS